MYLSRRGCWLRQDGLSKLGLRTTTQCRRISIFLVAAMHLRDMCPKLSWESKNLEKMCVMKLFLPGLHVRHLSKTGKA